MHKRSLLPPAWQIPDKLRDRLGEEPGRQRIMQAEGHLLLILHAPPAADEASRQGRFYWRQPDGTWSAAVGPAGPGALAVLLDEYAAALDRLDKTEEQASGARAYFEVLDQLTPLARATRNLYATLQEARQSVPEDRRLIVARDRAYALSRRAELLQADARNALDFAIAARAEEQAATGHQMAIAAHRLNLLVAFFFPIATLSAIFGMDLGHGMENLDDATAPVPLLAVIGMGLLLGTILTTFVTRQRLQMRRTPDRER